MALKPLGGMMRGALSDKGALVRIEATLILEEFEKIVINILGEKFRGVYESISFKDGTLMVKCESSVAAQELRINEARIICELNKILKNKTAHEIRIFR
ncbi:MAG: DUF721 domain-containing protein [Parcubacteria group bacterium]|nr:DUF721 domain-containing protein [Parcubacteria group bacterium]